MGVALYGGWSRSRTEEPGRTTHHSFSFGPHYDPANLGFGPLVAHQDDHLAPGGGYPDHPHHDTEIVTWVLDGVLVHTDSLGHSSALEPGTVQVQSAGSGIRHAEVADGASGPTRFVQAWLRPDEPGTPPQRHLATPGAPSPSGLVPVVGDEGLPLGVAGARLLVARLGPGEEVELPAGRRQHVFVATGSVALPELAEVAVPGAGGGTADPVAGPGDAWRVEDHPGLRLRADAGSELLVWDLPD